MSAENPCPMWLYGIACLLGVSEAAESQECGSSGCGQGGAPSCILIGDTDGKKQVFGGKRGYISIF